MPNEFTPSEQRVWDAAFGAAFESAYLEGSGVVGGSVPSEHDAVNTIAYAERVANRAVAALRAHRAAHGSWIGAALPGVGEDGGGDD